MGRKRKSDVKQRVAIRLYESTINYIRETGETLQAYIEKSVNERMKKEKEQREKGEGEKND